MTTPTTTARPNALTPAEAWRRLHEGNARFVADSMEHPSQSADRRTEVATDQFPHAVVFGCSDSRVAAEIVFDQGLGDLFVVRTAGHVLDTTVIGSIEYGVEVLGAPLVVVLGHDRCGAVRAAIDALLGGSVPPGFVRAVVDRVIPSLIAYGAGAGESGSRELALASDDELRRLHVRSTADTLLEYSSALAQAVKEGKVAIVGVEYTLADGTANVVEVLGEI